MAKKVQKKIYGKAKSIVGKIRHIFTDANSCYDVIFQDVPEAHTMTKAETHLIESSNSLFRDNLARFDRKTKRYSKSLKMLEITLDLFLDKTLHDFDYELNIT